MLYNFLNPFYANILAFLTSFAIIVIFGRKFIDFMHAWQHEGQPIRECGPQSHLATKKGTPTMGGLLILASIIISTLCFAKHSSPMSFIIGKFYFVKPIFNFCKIFFSNREI